VRFAQALRLGGSLRCAHRLRAFGANQRKSEKNASSGADQSHEKTIPAARSRAPNFYRKIKSVCRVGPGVKLAAVENWHGKCPLDGCF
jgi:hypothetical protein